MKRIVSILAIVCLMSTLTTGQSVDVERGCVPLTVNFEGISGLTNPLWRFGDGISSTATDPTYVYNSAGVYTATLSDGDTGLERASFTISVFAPPTIDIDIIQPDICAPSDITLNPIIGIDDGLNITEYNWSINGTSNSDSNPTVTFNAAGTYPVSLEVMTDVDGCSTTAAFPDAIMVQGVAAQFDLINETPCELPVTASFINTSLEENGLTYLWDFGNGTTSTDRTPADVTYTDAGNYAVSLTVTTVGGCISTRTRVVQAGTGEQLTMVPDTFCIGIETLIENNTEAPSHTWIAVGAEPSVSTLPQPVFRYDTPGPKVIRYTARLEGGCTIDSTYRIIVQDPDGSFTVDPLISCTDPLLITASAIDQTMQQYIWNDSTTNSPTFTFAYSIGRDSLYLHQADTIPILLVATTTAGCVVEDSTFAIQRRPNAELISNTVRGCAPLTVQFSDISNSIEPIVSYTWIFGTGDSAPNDDTTATYTYNNPGIYTARLIIENDAGCIDTSSAYMIYVGEQIAADLPPYALDICLGETIDLETPTMDDRIQSYLWRTDDGRQSDCYGDNVASITYDTDPGTYDISLLTEYNGCYATTTIENAVTVRGASAKVGYQIDCDNPFVVPFVDRGIGATERSWDFGGVGSSIEEEPIFTFPDTGDYEIVLITSDPSSGCPADTSRTTVHIRDLKAVITIPEIGCDNESVTLRAGDSEGVHDDCFRGYVWQMPNVRPREVAVDSIMHRFFDTGPNPVTVTVRDINGCTTSVTDTIEIYGIDPEFAISDDTICLPATLDITNTTTADTSIVEWQWSFGSTSENPGSVTYINANFTGNITLNVVDAIGCEDAFQIPITRYIPNSIAIIEPDVACVGDTVRVIASDYTAGGSLLAFDWDFGVFGSSTLQRDEFIADQPGNFLIRLDYEEIGTGCGSSTSRALRVVDIPTADFVTQFGDDDIICFNNTIEFFGSSSMASDMAIYEWDLDGFGTPTGDTVQTVFNRGTYDITLTITEPAGCSSEVTKTFDFIGPDGAFDSDADSICFGDDVTFFLLDTTDVLSFAWSFGDGSPTIEGGDMVTHTYDMAAPENEQIAVTLILTSAENNCVTNIVDSILIRNTVAGFLPIDGSEFCPGENVVFTNISIGANTYMWDFGNGLQGSMSVNPSSTYGVRGSYEVELIASDAALGCIDTISQSIMITDPVLDLTVPNVCEGEESFIIINDFNPAFDYEVRPTAGVEIVGDSIFLGVLASSTEYVVRGIDPNGCDQRDTVLAQVIPTLPDGVIDVSGWVDEELILPIDGTLGILDPNSIEVEIESDTDVDCDDCLDPVIPSLDWQATFLNIYIGAGDCRDTLEYRLHPTGCGYFPNFFGSGGTNENFNLVTREGGRNAIRLNDLQVIDRWGKTVYDNLSTAGWNGQSTSGENHPSDVYSWYGIIEITSGDTRLCKGNVTLAR